MFIVTGVGFASQYTSHATSTTIQNYSSSTNYQVLTPVSPFVLRTRIEGFPLLRTRTRTSYSALYVYPRTQPDFHQSRSSIVSLSAVLGRLRPF
jgi:hypothetical protein